MKPELQELDSVLNVLLVFSNLFAYELVVGLQSQVSQYLVVVDDRWQGLVTFVTRFLRRRSSVNVVFGELEKRVGLLNMAPVPLASHVVLVLVESVGLEASFLRHKPNDYLNVVIYQNSKLSWWDEKSDRLLKQGKRPTFSAEDQVGVESQAKFGLEIEIERVRVVQAPV